MLDNFKVIVGDVDTSIEILKEVAQWCEENKLNMWEAENLTKELLTAGVEEENFCVGRVGGENACSMILQWYDPLFWPEAKKNEAGYIHKLCVRRKFAGMGLSGEMLKFAESECRIRGIKYLRLDTYWGREPLCMLYEDFGFRKVGKRILRYSEFVLYEKVVEP